MNFTIVSASRRKQAFAALGRLRLANVPAVMDQQVVQMRPIFLWKTGGKIPFHPKRCVAVRESQTMTQTKDVGIHRNGVTAKGDGKNDGMQIDLLISRMDNVVNLCEMKFSSSEFEVKNEDDRKLRERIQRVMEQISRRHSIQVTLVTTFGLKYGIHSGIFQQVVTLDKLFQD